MCIVTLRTAQMSVARSQVSTVVNFELEIFRSTSIRAAVWQLRQCYELYVESPYLAKDEYQSFKAEKPPTCDGLTNGLQVECMMKSAETVQFWFATVEVGAEVQQSVRIGFTNFHTPFSSQLLNNIKLRSYSDQDCLLNVQEFWLPSVTTQPAFMPANVISVKSSSNELGHSGQDNTLTVAFTPQTQFAPGGQGKIEIGMPYWWQVGLQNEMMYNGDYQNECTSVCMTITSSLLQGSLINIKYTDMLPECFKGKQVVIECSYFRNPIYQDIWYGFFVNIYDNEPKYKAIEKSDMTPYLDARAYTPQVITSRNFLVTPSDNTVNTVSEWTLQVQPGIPMVRDCFIRLWIPSEITLNYQSIEASGIFLPKNLNYILSSSDFDILNPTSQDPLKSITFTGCNDDNTLGQDPQGRLYINSLTTQRSVKSSGDFKLEIYKNSDMTQLIATLEQGYTLSSQGIQAGWLDSIKVYPYVWQVQSELLMYVNFTISHDLQIGSKVVLGLPQGLGVPEIGTQIDVIGLMTESSEPVASTVAKVATVTDTSTVEILDFIQNSDVKAPYTFWIMLTKLSTQLSAKDAGEFTITTYDLDKDGLYYVVDSQRSKTSFVAEPGMIEAFGQILVDNPTNYAEDAVYTFNFQGNSMVPSGGYFVIDFPTDVSLTPQTALSSSVCLTSSHICTILSAHSLQLQTTQPVPKEQLQSLSIRGVKNPRTTAPSGLFIVSSYDSDGVSQIDSGFQMNTFMTQAGLISEFQVTRESTVNGARNTYGFKVTSEIVILRGDVLKFTFPDQIGVNAGGSQTICTPLSANTEIFCGISGNDIQIQVLKAPPTSLELLWQMSNIANPISLQPSDPFHKIQFLSATGYLIAQAASNHGILTNTDPADLIQLQSFQDSFKPIEPTTYSFTFTPVNALPFTALILLQLPKQVQISQPASETRCIVTTNQVFAQNCVFSSGAVLQSVQIKGVFESHQHTDYSSQITVTLSNVTNPIDNRNLDPFVISTYTDDSMAFIVDTSSTLLPKLLCDYPCKECRLDNRKACSSCFNQDPDYPQFLMSYTDGLRTGQCLNKCEYGFTSNGAVDKQCQKCDESCGGCQDNGESGDYKKCVDCAVDYPFTFGGKCLTECNSGLFLPKIVKGVPSTLCAECDKSCYSCSGQADYCTSCNASGAMPVLYQNKCTDVCPVGFAAQGGLCVECQSPCVTCVGTPSKCTSCDLQTDFKLLFAKKCFDNCPPGYTSDLSANTCVGCESGCDLCDTNNSTLCFKCQFGLSLNEVGVCSSGCPDGQIQQNGVCISSTIEDMALMQYPFLIAAILFSVMVLAGKMKKKIVLDQGKRKLISQQHTISAIVAFVAPLQTVATFSQWVLAFYYKYYLHFVLAFLVSFAQVGFNVYFAKWFHRNFYKQYVPQVGQRIIHKKRQIEITEKNAHRYLQDKDPEFRSFVQKHRLSSLFVMGFTCVHFETFKLFYSHFYSFDMFKAKFHKATYLRESLQKFSLLYVCVLNSALIGVSLFGLLQVSDQTQLHINMIETAVLSVFMTVVQVIERIYLKRIFEYTESPQNKYRAKGMTGYSKRLKLKYMILKIKKSGAFKDRKIEDLLGMFGSRHCQSMMDLLGDGREEDPRQLVTWPVSPSHHQELMDMIGDDFKFTKADAYVVMTSRSGKGQTDQNLQNERDKEEFLTAIGRKNAGLMGVSSEVDEHGRTRLQRKRGRKNKYQAYVDFEDDQDEQENEEEYLRLLKQQADEEESLKRLVTIGAQKQQEILDNKRKQLRRQYDEEQALLSSQRTSSDLQLQQDQNSKETQRLADQDARQRQADLEAERLAREKQLQDEAAKTKRLEQMRQAQLLADKEAQRLVAEKQKITKQISVKDLNPAATVTPIFAKQPTLKSPPLPVPQPALQNQVKKERPKKIALMSINSDDNGNTSSIVALNQDPLRNFKQQEYITIPPNAQLRTFNELDILGVFDRDEKGNVIVLEDKSGNKHDKLEQSTNIRGYLTDPKTQNLIENLTSKLMFPSADLDPKTNDLPAPYCLEKHNFNPHTLIGDFDYHQDGKPKIIADQNNSFVDKRGRKVNAKGLYTDSTSCHVVDNTGRKKFSESQLEKGDLFKLFTLQGKRFDIRDVIGEFDKDCYGNIQLLSYAKQFIDKRGRTVNEKGYLTDGVKGNIIDRQGKRLFPKSHLKSGEFIKIFPFSRFNIARVQGDLPAVMGGAMTKDRRQRIVNMKGYLVDQRGNVTDQFGNVMFDKESLEKDGEIPSVFRTGLLKSDTGSSISRLMSEIERIHHDQSDAGEMIFGEEGDDPVFEKKDGETSVDSKEEDNLAEEQEGQILPQKKRRCKVRKVPPKKHTASKMMATLEILEPTSREVIMAGAYGGEAKAEIRKPNIKYSQDRLANSKKFRIAAQEEPKIRAQLTKLENQGLTQHLQVVEQTSNKKSFKDGSDTRKQTSGGGKRDSSAGESTLHQRQSKGGGKRKHKIAGGEELDFERVYGKDIEQFLDDSEWDIDSFDKISLSDDEDRQQQFALATGRMTEVMTLEQAYLQGTGIHHQQAPHSKKQRSTTSVPHHGRRKHSRVVPQPYPPMRETILSVTDDPVVIHKGEILEFDK